MRLLIVLAVLVCFAVPVHAQVVTAPTAAVFEHSDADYNTTSGYRMEFFQCGSVTGGACVGRAAAPFQTGAVVPKTSVTGPATARTFPLATLPGNPLSSLPAGVGFVGTVVAIGDPNTGGSGESARSTDSNPFFASGRTPASPANLAVQ